ncbi:hypothetical protein HNR02_002365 [Amycolatopsis endophytica]|uniref:Uncharacterized protein n=1 Tax=Amycolatopsis endophytica TaxID=860233 RepID=A0A853B2G0_9PSEU|nr:hypothetical protein [Amycolatopsis endophytica]
MAGRDVEVVHAEAAGAFGDRDVTVAVSEPASRSA